MNAGRRCFVDPSVLFQATGEPFKALKDVICFRPCRSERPRSTTTLPSLLFAVHSPKMTSGVFLTVANMRGTLGWWVNLRIRTLKMAFIVGHRALSRGFVKSTIGPTLQKKLIERRATRLMVPTAEN